MKNYHQILSGVSLRQTNTRHVNVSRSDQELHSTPKHNPSTVRMNKIEKF